MKYLCLEKTKPKDYVIDLIESYSSIENIDVEKAFEILKETKKFYDSKSTITTGFAYELQNRWYESLKNKKPDYTVYGEKYYFTDLINCWQMYSRNYILSLKKNFLKNTKIRIIDYMKNVNSILDLGCGLGLTTALLKQTFPNCKVVGTNIKNTKQFEFCQRLSSIYNFDVTTNEEITGEYDLIFASEYYEHIENVVSEINYNLHDYKPKYLYLANSFNTISVGHFHEYKFKGNEYHEDIIYKEKDVSRAFNQQLKFRNYQQIKTTNWNNKPTLWKKL